MATMDRLRVEPARLIADDGVRTAPYLDQSGSGQYQADLDAYGTAPGTCLTGPAPPPP